MRPVGIENITFFPDGSMKSSLTYMHTRTNQVTSASETTFTDIHCFQVKSSNATVGGAGDFGRSIEFSRTYHGKAPPCLIVSVLTVFTGILGNDLERRPKLERVAQILKTETVNGM